ncbi:MAG: AsmA family protein [Alphaproteobacteria bacterium]|jgi:uncharacterized protein involved in outer membrane biogenesis|nr:AsmA family protein [Alphaproteobacteria bacterium]
MGGRRVPAVLAGLLAMLAILVAGAGLALAFVDLRPLAQSWLAASLGREVAIGALRLDWDNPLTIELRDVTVANAPWGSAPEMLRLGRLAGQLDPAALMRGEMRYQWVEAVGVRLVMERDGAGRGNWQNGESGAQDRASVPTVLKAVLRDALIRYRTSSGRFLDIALTDLNLRAGGDDQPIKLDAVGSYNDIPAKLDATLQSFTALRDGAKPYGANFTLANAGVRIAFDGSFTRPLDIDGARGRLDIVARKLGDLTRVFGARTSIEPGLKLVGDLTRDGNRWHLDEAGGRLGEDVFEGTITLHEGGRGQADDIALNLDFPHLDLAPLLAGTGGQGDLGLPAEADAARIRARVTANEADYGRLRAEDAELVMRVGKDEAAIDALNFALGGGRVTASASAANVEGGVSVSADLAWSGADADVLARRLGAAPGQIAGRFDARASVRGVAATTEGLIKAAQGQAIIGMEGGLIARDLLEKLSGDLRTLLRKGEGRTQISCLLGVVVLGDGIARLAPLRLRATEGVAIGGGQIDLVRRRLDVVLRTERASTSFFALDVPLRVSGRLDDPHVAPTTVAAVAPYETAVVKLGPDLAPIAEGNPCRN